MALDGDSLRPTVEPLVDQAGFDLDDLVVRPAGRRTSVVVVVDGDRVGIDALAELSRSIAVALDDVGVMGESPYNLEVTSRGVGRPLSLPRHWERNRGRLVTVRLHDGDVVKGRILAADDDGADVGGQRVEYANITKAVVEVDFTAKDDTDTKDVDGAAGDGDT